MPIARLMLVPMTLVAIAGATASAQDGASTQPVAGRHGVWLSSGIGGGWNVLGNAGTGAGMGWSGYWRLGGTPSRRLRLGAEFSYWLRRHDELVTERGNLACVGQY